MAPAIGPHDRRLSFPTESEEMDSSKDRVLDEKWLWQMIRCSEPR